MTHRWADQQTAAPRKLQVLLHALAGFGGARGIVQVSQQAIRDRIGWDKGTIKKWSDLGRALGLLSTKKRFNPRLGHCDAMIYSLHLDRVVTPEEVARQSSKLRFAGGRQIGKTRFAPPRGKSEKWGICLKSEKPDLHGGGKSELAANNLLLKEERKTSSQEGSAQEPAQGGEDYDWFPSREDLT